VFDSVNSGVKSPIQNKRPSLINIDVKSLVLAEEKQNKNKSTLLRKKKIVRAGSGR